MGLALGLLVVCGCSDRPAPVKADAGATRVVGDADQARLERGEVVITPLQPTGGEGIAALARALVEAPPAAVWPVVRDCQHFSAFMPRTKVSRRSDDQGDEFTCFVEIEMPFPLSNLKSTTRSTVAPLPGGGHVRRWTLVSGDYERNGGSWAVKPWGASGQRSLLEYRVDVKPKMAMPDAIAQRAQSSSLPKLFEAIRVRARAGG